MFLKFRDWSEQRGKNEDVERCHLPLQADTLAKTFESVAKAKRKGCKQHEINVDTDVSVYGRIECRINICLDGWMRVAFEIQQFVYERNTEVYKVRESTKCLFYLSAFFLFYTVVREVE